jgi:hypothetical protein
MAFGGTPARAALSRQGSMETTMPEAPFRAATRAYGARRVVHAS